MFKAQANPKKQINSDIYNPRIKKSMNQSKLRNLTCIFLTDSKALHERVMSERG